VRRLTKPEVSGKISVFASLYFAKLTFSEIVYQKREGYLFMSFTTPYPFLVVKSDQA